MITIPSTFSCRRLLLTMAAILTVISTWSGSATEHWPEEGVTEDFWYDILTISEEEPSFQMDLGGPTAINLPFVEAPTEVRWTTKEDVTVYMFTDHWQLQESHGATFYEGEAIVAFLPSPTTEGFAYIGTETFGVDCGGIQARLSGVGKAETSGRSTSKALAIAAAKTQAHRDAKADSTLAVLGYDGCPNNCKIPTKGIGWINVTHSGSSRAFFNSLFDEVDRYTGWAKYEWSTYVICRKPSSPSASRI